MRSGETSRRRWSTSARAASTAARGGPFGSGAPRRGVVAIERPERLHGHVEQAAGQRGGVLRRAQQAHHVGRGRHQHAMAVQLRKPGVGPPETEQPLQSGDLGHALLDEPPRGLRLGSVQVNGPNATQHRPASR